MKHSRKFTAMLATRRKFTGFLGTAACVISVSLSAAGGGTVTWTGSGSDSGWATAGNWSADPAEGDSLNFAGSNRLANNNNNLLSTAGTVTLSGAGWNIGGSAITLTGDFISAGSNTWGIETALSGTRTIGNSSGTLSMTGRIGGTGTLVKSGVGTLALSGPNTYAGGTKITAGTVAITADENLGTVPLSATPGSLVIDGGILATTGSFSLASNRGIVVGPTSGQGNGTLEITGTLFYDGIITSNGTSGTGNLVKTGTGTLVLGGANTYTGNTVVSAGTLRIGAVGSVPSGLGRGDVTVDGTLDLNGFGSTVNGLYGSGVVTNGNGGAITFTAGGNNRAGGFSGVIQDGSGTTAFAKTGTGILTLSGANTFTGGVTIAAGTLRLGSVGALNGSTPNAVAFASAAPATTSLQLNGNSVTIASLATGAIPGSAVVENANASAATLTISQAASTTFAGSLRDGTGGGSLGITKSGAGSLALAGTNTFTGGMTVSGGTLVLAGGSALGDTTAVTMSNTAGVSLQLSASETIGSLAGGGTSGGNLNLQAFTLTTGGANSSTSYAGVISGSGALVKTGTGTMTLSRASTFTGTTAVRSGTIQLGTDNALPASTSMTLGDGTTNASGVLDLNNFSQTLAGLATAGTGASNRIINPGATTRSLTLDIASASSFAGILGGTTAADSNFNLVKTGAGTMTLSGTNTYTGTTTIASGTLSAGNLANNLGNSTSPLVFTGGALYYTGANTVFTRGLTVNAGGGEIVTSGGQTLTLATGNVATSGAFTVRGVGNTTISSGITGTGSLNKAGSGTLVLSGGNTYSGPTNLRAGTITLGVDNALNPTGTLTMGDSTLNTSGTLKLNGFSQSLPNIVTNSAGNRITGGTVQTSTLTVNNTGSLAFGGILGGSGTNDNSLALVKTGAGILTLSGTNTFTGGTTHSAGTLAVGAAANLGATSGQIAINAATLQLTSSLSVSHPISLNQATSAISVGSGLVSTLAGALSGAGALNLTGSGTLTVSGGSNTYGGGTNLLNGTLLLGTSNALPSATLVTLGSGTTGGTLALNGYNQTISGVATSGTGTNRVVNRKSTGATLTISNSADTIFSGILGGTGTNENNFGLTKTGAGTLTLGGANTFAGALTVSTGTLALSGGSAVADSGAVTLANDASAALRLNASETIGSLAGGGASGGGVNLQSFNLTAGGNNGTTTFGGGISGTGGLNKQGTGTLTLSGANTYTGTTTISAGTLAVSGGSALADNGAVSMGTTSGVLLLNANETIGSLAGGGSQGGNVNLQTYTLTVGGNEASTNFAGTISGTGGITKTGAGSLTLSRSNTYGGTTSISNGTLIYGANAALPSGVSAAGVAIGTAGVLDINGRTGSNATINGLSGTGTIINNSLGSSGVITLGANNATSTFNGTLTNGTGVLSLAKTGTGTLTLTPGTDNPFTGGITINGGIVQAGNANALNSLGLNAVTFGSGVAAGTKLQLNGYSVTIAGLATNNTAGSPVVENASASGATLTISTAGSYTYAGVIQNGSGSGVLSLVKTGSGTQILSGSNTYTGTTGVLGGVLSIGADANLGNAPATPTGGSLVIAGGTLKFTNSSDITLSANRGIALGSASGTGAGTVDIVSSPGTIRTVAYAGAITNSGGDAGQLIKTGLGNLALSGTNTFSGGIAVNAGLVSVTTAGSGALGTDAAENGVSVSAGGNLSLSSASNKGSNQSFTVASGLSGRGGIGFSSPTLSQASLAGLFANNTGSYGGVLGINSGITYATALDLSTFGSGDNLGIWFLGSASSGTYSPTTLTVGAGNTYRLGGGGGSLTLSGTNVLTGSNGVLVGFGGGNGNGVVTLGANQNYAGTTTVTGGAVLSVDADGRLGSGSGSGNIVLDGGILRATANFTLASSRGILLGSSSGTGIGTIDINSSRTLTYGGVIANNGAESDALAKTGAGTLILTATSVNTFTGTTNLNAGVVQFSRIENLGAGTAIAFAGGTLRYASGNTTDITTRSVTTGGATIDTNGNDVTFGNSAITGTGAFTKTGAGILSMDVANAYTGTTTISAGTVKLGHTAAIPSGAGNGALSVGGTLDLNNLNPTVNLLSGSGTVTNSNSGASILTVNTSNSSSGSTFSGSILNGDGTLSLTKIGANTLTLSGASSTYTGGTRILAGTLSVTNDRALGSVPDFPITNIILASGTTLGSSTNSFEINANRGIAIDGATAASLAAASGLSLTYNGIISNTAGSIGGLTKTNTTGTLTLGGVNTYAGDTTVSGGTLKITNASAIPSGTYKGNVSIASANSGQIDLNGYSITINGLTGAGMIRSNIPGAASVTIGGNDTTSSFSGTVLNGDAASVVSLAKIGTGTLTLSGLNSHTGGTSIWGGTLSVSADANLGAVPGSATPAALTINGGTLATSASFTLSANRGLAIGPSAGSGVATLAPTSGTTLTIAATIADNGAGIGTLDKSNTTGTLSLTAANTYSGDTTVSGGTLLLGNTAAIPSGPGKGNLSLAAGTTLDLNGFDQTVNGLSGTGTLTNGATAAVTITAGANGTGGSFGGVIQDGSGAVSLTKTGTGTLTLTAANTYSGNTTIHAGGILEAGNSAAIPFGFGKGNVIANGTLAVANSLTVNGLSGSGLLTNTSAGAVILTAGSNDQSSLFSGTISNGTGGGSIGLAKIGTGTLTLSGVNTFSGTTTITAGTLAMGSATGLSATSSLTIAAAGMLDVNGFSVATDGLAGTGTITNNGAASAVVISGASGASTTFGGSITDGTSQLSLLKSGSGTLTLTGLNAYSGTTTIADGTLSVANPGESGAIGTASGAVILGGSSTAGTLSYTTNADLTFTRGFTVNAGGGRMDITSSGRTLTLQDGGIFATGTFTIGGAGNAVINSVISGTGGFTKANTGTTAVNSANTYEGDTTVTIGTLLITNTAAIPSGSGKGNVIVNGSLDVNNLSLILNGLSGSGSVTNSAGAPVSLTLGDNNALGNFTGAILDGVGTIALRKIGIGSQTLGGANGYSGDTTVSAGTLRCGNPAAIPSGTSKGNVILETNATLDLNGFDATVNGLSGTGLVTNHAGASTLSVGSADQTCTFSGNIRDGLGTLGLTKTGTGTLTLSGNNTFSGATTIAQGTLSMGGDSGLSSASTLTIDSAGALDLNGRVIAIDGLAGTGSITNNSATDVILTIGSSGGSGTFGGTINDGMGLIGLIKAGSGTITLSRVNSYSGNTIVTGGLLAITSYGALGQIPPSVHPANIMLDGGGISAANTFEIDSKRGITVGPSSGSGSGILAASENQTLTYFGVITNNGAGTGGLTIAGAGTVALGGANTFSGNTNIAQGSLQIANTAAIPHGAGKGNVELSGTLDLNQSDIVINGLSGSGTVGNSKTGSARITIGDNDQSGTFSGSFTDGIGTVAVTKIGAGTLALAGASFHSGGTVISRGVLALEHGGALAGSGTVSMDGGTLRFSTSNTTDYSLRIRMEDGKSAIFDTNGQQVTFASPMPTSATGTASLVKTGSGKLTLLGSNTYTGGTSITQGTLELGNGDANGGILGTVSNSGLLIYNNGSAQSDSGMIQGTGDVVKSGSGRLVLSSTHTYSGTTGVEQGTLLVNGTLDGNGLVSVAAGSILGGTGTIRGNVNVSGVLSPGASIETLHTGSVVMNPGSSFAYEINSDILSADLMVTDGLSLNDVGLNLPDLAAVPTAFGVGTVFTLFNYGGPAITGGFTGLADDSVFTAGLNTWKIDYNSTSGGSNFTGEHVQPNFVNISIIPEPSSLLLCGAGALLTLRRRRTP